MYCILTTILMLHLIFEIAAINGIQKTKHFQILSNYKEVEKEVVWYAGEYKRTIRSKVQSVGSFLSRNICNTSSLDVRIAFCGKALRIDFYGFEFDLTSYSYSACQPQNFWTKSQVPFTSNPLQLDMFSCPPIKYKDILTDEEVFLPYTYSASRGKSSDTAFVFVHEEMSNIKYPVQYIKNIHSKALKNDEKMEDFNNWDSLPRIGSKMLKQRSYAEDEDKTYEKFRSRLTSINVCGLRQKHKIFLCRRSVEDYLDSPRVMKFDTRGYNAKCEKHRIDPNRFTLKLKKEQRVVLCPPLRSSAESTIKLREDVVYYISTSVQSFTTMLFYRQNMKGQKLRLQKLYTHSANNLRLKQDIHRDRFIPYPSEEQQMKRASRKSVNQFINSLNSVHFSADEEQRSIPRISEDGFYVSKFSSDLDYSQILKTVWVTEDLMISFSKFKAITEVYRRFMTSYRSISLCGQSDSRLQEICNQIVINNAKTTNPTSPVGFQRDEDSSCHRRPVILRVYEAEKLETDTFAMRQCRSSTHSSSLIFFIGKVHLKNTAILYRSPLNLAPGFDANAVYPHEVLINIKP